MAQLDVNALFSACVFVWKGGGQMRPQAYTFYHVAHWHNGHTAPNGLSSLNLYQVANAGLNALIRGRVYGILIYKGITA